MKKGEIASNGGMIGQEEQFLFVGEMLALDLVNTEVVVRGRRQDKLQAGADVRVWWEEVRGHYPEVENVRGENEESTVYDQALLDALKELRGALRHIFGAMIEGNAPIEADVRVLNEALRTGYHALEYREDGNLLAVYHSYDRTKGEVLLPIALSALRLIQDSERKRLHKCDNERCILYFYDTTKSATRRWCSPGCMDRARSAQRYKRAKERNILKL